MSEMGTPVDKPYAQQPETREAARQVITSYDLLPMLGLDDEPPEPPSAQMIGRRLRCAVCWQPVRADGVCRRRDCGGAR